MERMLVMRKVHEGQLPTEWAAANGELVDLVKRMFNRLPNRRPSAQEVVSKVCEEGRRGWGGW
jgi:hypothetical protein